MRPVLLLLSFVTLPATVLAQGWILPRPCVVPPSRDDRPLPVPICRPFPVANVVRTRSDVRAELANGIVRYEVDERFVNRGGGIAEADYLFPLPSGAAFQDLKLSINGELVAGETMDAGEARGVYEEIVRRQRDPALVEWIGSGLLRARIFPIRPGEEKRVVVRFQSIAEREGGALVIRGLRQAGAARQDGTNSFVLSYSASASFGTPYSPTHALDASDSGGRRWIRVHGDARDLTLLLPLRRATEVAVSALAYAPGGEDGFTLITLSPPQPTAVPATTPRDVTFVLDVSGSMAGKKMEQARAAGKQLLGTLQRGDRFRLIDFSTDVRSFRDDFVYATDDNVQAARRYLDALEAEGSTNISGALDAALRPSNPAAAGDGEAGNRLAVMLFITDGEPTIGERRPTEIAAVAARERGQTRLFTFGVGSDVNASLLEQLALEGGGTAQFVRPDESVERVVGIVASRLMTPVVTNMHVHVNGDIRLSEMLPAGPMDLFAGQDLILLARYVGHGRGTLVFEGQRRGAPMRWTAPIDFPERQRDNSFVARLWATQRIGYLSAEKRRNGGSTELDDEIRRLGERFGIPTEFTSYLVREPGMVAGPMMQASGGVQRRSRDARAPASAPSAELFGMAKTAAAQRSATSIAVVDSIAVAQRSAASPDAGVRHIEGRTFLLRDGRWVDTRYREGSATVRIAAYSHAYFDLLSQLAELRPVFALGEAVVVTGRAMAIEVVRAGTPAPDPEPDVLRRLISDW